MNASSRVLVDRYDPSKSYRWNYDHAPDPVRREIPELPGSWSFAGRSASGPIGIPAGPLLNGRWILYYASLGFDVLTYKTVRSRSRACYPLPNLVYVPDRDRVDEATDLRASEEATGTWAVSFGMPSSEPERWRFDIDATRRALPREKRLNVSVVGTVQPGWSMEQLADDYALCARWAVESGADTVEANLSCPNVSTCDGQLYQRPADARRVAETIRAQIGSTPLILKVGHMVDPADAGELLRAVGDAATAIAMTNSVAGRVQAADDRWLFDGEPRGICGAATFRASLSQVAMFTRLIDELGLSLRVIGVGGASTAEQVREYLDAGAECVHLATAAMLNPNVGIEIKKGLSARNEP